ncbi:MAG: molybdopterin-dependent oxidoreductase [Candidatus Tectomicrobia bacterium]|nr:molybdopterin-dependent oxidoreductase [Candidatus Tectomicrobia bacterium]
MVQAFEQKTPETERAHEANGEDRWIPSACSMCYGTCSILAHRVNGVVTKIEGNPASEIGKGRLCAKGISGIMTLYDPNRVNVPLRRTNPKKGVGVDPGWKEITWDEALDEIAARLRKVRAEDPRKLFLQRTTTNTTIGPICHAFCHAFGTMNQWVAGGGLHCGNGAHLISGIMHASWSIVPDFEHCQYAVYFGASKGHAAGHASCSNMGLAADARVRGMKMVVVDPMCNFAAAKANEWVPIRVGTDAALALAMAHVLVNELGIWDAPYLASKTNAPYLIGPDKLYVRDAETQEPLVWDATAGRARPYNAEKLGQEPLGELALEGEYEAQGVRCRPAFACLKEHLARHTPEWAEPITTIPAATIRRLGQEFGREARVGSTIVIDGVRLPYRPVAAIAFRGSEGHRNAVYNFLAIDLLNHLVGAADVVGGCLGFNPVCHGHPETKRPAYVPYAGPDGLMVTGSWMVPHLPYPFEYPRMPKSMGFNELFPLGMSSPLMASADQEERWQRFDLPYRPEVMINIGCNSVMSVGNSETVINTLLRIPFIVSFDLFRTELSDLADIVLPDMSYLEQLDSKPNYPFIFNLPGGMGDWCWAVRQPLIEPVAERRQMNQVLLELAERVGISEDINMALNALLKLQPPFTLKGSQQYSFAEVCDQHLKSNFGPRHDLAWFKEHGVLSWPKKPQEVYWRPFVEVRVPIYWEYLKRVGDQARALAEPRGLHLPEEFYDPLPTWLPCPGHECSDEQFDLYGFYYRDTIHTNSLTQENAWLDETAQLDPNSYYIAMNAETGKKKGLHDGDWVWMETVKGRRVRGRVHLTQGMHPEGLGIGGCAGHWTDGMPVARGKGVFFNQLLEIDMDHASPVNLNLDLCVKVRLRRCEEA